MWGNYLKQFFKKNEVVDLMRTTEDKIKTVAYQMYKYNKTSQKKFEK